LENAKDSVIQVTEIIEENNYYPFGLKHKGYNELPDYSVTNKYKYAYGGKELNSELGLELYDFGARNYDAAIGRWLNVDPLAENTIMSYQYSNNNPIRFADPSGMIGEDVIIKGNMAQEAFNSLQNSVSSELELKMSKSGKVTAKQIGEGQLSQGATDLLAATKDKSVTVNVDADNSPYNIDKTTPIKSIRIGSFMGSFYNEDGTVNTRQSIQPEILDKLDIANNKTPGQSVLHEVTESYKAGKITQEQGYGVNRVILQDMYDRNSIYYRAHNGVTPAGGGLRTDYIFDSNSKPIKAILYTGEKGNVKFHEIDLTK